MQSDKYFPNGFKSWAETFFEVSNFIYEEQVDNREGTAIAKTQEALGRSGLVELAVKWTDEYEASFNEIAGTQKDYSTLDIFLSEKNK